jgi:lysozyme family protein
MSYSDIFNKAFEHVIGLEGGYVDDPNDRGGETKYGISKRAYPNIDIKNMTLEEAKKIYYDDYWNDRRLNLDEIEDEAVAIELFDTGVNMGQATARKFLQEALNLLNRNEKLYPDLKVDGWCGQNTMAAYRKVKPNILLKVLNGLQFEKYKKIVEKNPVQEKFFAGWMKRV